MKKLSTILTLVSLFLIISCDNTGENCDALEARASIQAKLLTSQQSEIDLLNLELSRLKLASEVKDSAWAQMDSLKFTRLNKDLTTIAFNYEYNYKLLNEYDQELSDCLSKVNPEQGGDDVEREGPREPLRKN